MIKDSADFAVGQGSGGAEGQENDGGERGWRRLSLSLGSAALMFLLTAEVRPTSSSVEAMYLSFVPLLTYSA